MQQSGAAFAAPNKGTTILYWFRSPKTVLNPVNGKIQELFKVFECFSSTFQCKFNFLRTFQDSPVYSSTLQACANPVQASPSCLVSLSKMLSIGPIHGDLSWYDWKTVDWDVKNQNKQTNKLPIKQIAYITYRHSYIRFFCSNCYHYTKMYRGKHIASFNSFLARGYFVVCWCDNLCKQSGPRSGLTKCRSWSWSKCFTTLIVFPNIFFSI